MTSFVEKLNIQKINRLKEWRGRYDREEYPFKVATNLLYEALTIKEMWPELLQSFQEIGGMNNKSKFNSFSESHHNILTRRREIQINKIHPVVEDAYLNTDSILQLNFNSLRNRVVKAQRGDRKMVEEIEFTYYFYTFSYEMIYAWSALGLMGYDKQTAYNNITSVFISDVDFKSINSMINAFGRNASLLYNPLPSL